ncbi:MAG: heme-copper oxidase subunit III [Cyanobacteria bacterium M_surface_7_m2_037]|nr:heme-copper oxidase subunit III [Cyanobacteria bacterium K_DeepCast_0m_m1_088]MBM5795312.1 heme-copper oxidase subunit III [Cyanobacteria bacterium M_surface_7_m2_037]
MTTTTLQQPGTPAEHEQHPKHNLTGFIIFLCSESVIFLAFFSGYALLKTSALNWLPDGVDGLEWRMPLVNTIVLVSSSGTIALAEHFKNRENMLLFRGFWLMSMAMGAYFLYGQAVEWSGLQFGFTSGTFGGTFYLLTGFHGLHVATGILLMGLMLIKSFIPGNYSGGEQGVQATSLFWHFVDVIWIILFLLIYVWQ